jgi:hypothetical protein
MSMLVCLGNYRKHSCISRQCINVKYMYHRMKNFFSNLFFSKFYHRHVVTPPNESCKAPGELK